MKYLVSNIKKSIEIDQDDVIKACAKKMGVRVEDISSTRIVKESIDARKKDNIFKVFSVVVDVPNKVNTGGDVRLLEEEKSIPVKRGTKRINTRPVVVGSGPCGLFTALILAQHGYKPIVLERGLDVTERSKVVNDYWENGVLDTECNVQFGEGGAGTFSDGKLTTRINDKRCELVLKVFNECGAPDEILYKAKPHIGSDILLSVVKNLRKRIESLGGEFWFNTKFSGINLKDSKLKEIQIDHERWMEVEVMALAIGHSSRDTFLVLKNAGLKMQPKAFSIGVRIEHPQEMINKAQYGKFAGHPALGAADYQLFQKFGERTAYSFCMCPGGTVVASASELGTVVTNGMSDFARDKQNANSALVVSVEPSDFDGCDPLKGVEFQRKWEHLAHKVAGENGAAPVQLVKDFLHSKKSVRLGEVKPSYTGEVAPSDMLLCLPKYVTDTMKLAIPQFARKINGFDLGDAVLTGVETRTSSPVRILRGENFEAEGVEGVYPAGEGAGYAGGIMSAAVDGIKVAEAIISKYLYN